MPLSSIQGPPLTCGPCLLLFLFTSSLSYSWLLSSLIISLRLSYAIVLSEVSVTNPTPPLAWDHIYFLFGASFNDIRLSQLFGIYYHAYCFTLEIVFFCYWITYIELIVFLHRFEVHRGKPSWSPSVFVSWQDAIWIIMNFSWAKYFMHLSLSSTYWSFCYCFPCFSTFSSSFLLKSYHTDEKKLILFIYHEKLDSKTLR